MHFRASEPAKVGQVLGSASQPNQWQSICPPPAGTEAGEPVLQGWFLPISPFLPGHGKLEYRINICKGRGRKGRKKEGRREGKVRMKKVEGKVRMKKVGKIGEYLNSAQHTKDNIYFITRFIHDFNNNFLT